jgi:coatomer subunit beta'
LNYGFERVWTLATRPGSKQVAIGYDTGFVVARVGQESAPISMDASGKMVVARHHAILQLHAEMSSAEAWVDGEAVPVSAKDLGSCELYPTALSHSSNGRFVAVVGDGEYLVTTALSFRHKAFGPGLGFAWSSDASE